MFKRLKKQKAPEPDSEKSTIANPYLNARREWDERYGDYIIRARNWRYAAFSMIGVAALAVGGIAWIGAQSKIQPYVVQVDQLGGPVAVATPVRDAEKAVTERVAQAMVSNWIWDARTVLADRTAQRFLIDRVYGMAGSNASAYLSEYYRANPPFGAFTRTAYVTSVLTVSKDTYQVTWDEVKMQQGDLSVTEHWKANITVGIDARLADSPKVALASPMGLFIKDVTWTRIFAGVESDKSKTPTSPPAPGVTR